MRHELTVAPVNTMRFVFDYIYLRVCIQNNLIFDEFFNDRFITPANYKGI